MLADFDRRLRDLEGAIVVDSTARAAAESAFESASVTVRSLSANDALVLDSTPNAWTPDPALVATIDVVNGQLTVTISANLALNDTGDLEMGVSLTGPTSVDFDRGHALATYSQAAPTQGSYQYVFNSLAVGTYTVTPGYYLASTSGTASFRTLVAQT